MKALPSRTALLRRAATFLACLPVTAEAMDVRIVTYNLQDDVSSPTPASALPNLATVLEGVGQQQYAGDGILQLPDVIAVQETTSNSATVAPLTADLNNYYGNSTLFASSTYQATTSDGNTGGGGPSGLIFNQTTMNLVASVGVGTPNSATNGEFRQVVRYEFQPLMFDKGTSSGIFYVYDVHSKSGGATTSDDGTTDGAMRNLEAQLIRNDEAANLPANASVIYVGDFNQDGSTEAAYQTMTAASSPSGVAQGAGIDPLNPTNNYTLSWGKNTLGFLTEKDSSLEYRDDLQLMTANIYNDAPGTLDYVAGSLHAFGNNGSVSYETSINSSNNTALNDIVGHGSLTMSQVLAAENTSIGSDHLPIVADYTIATQPNGIWSGGIGTWSNASLWSNSVVPNSTSIEVKIDNGNSIASVVTLNQNAAAEDLTLDINDTLNISSGFTLTLSGPNASTLGGTFNNAGGTNAAAITNTGTFLNTGTFTVTGNFNNSGTVVIAGIQNWSAGSVFTNLSGTALLKTDTGSTSAATLQLNVSGGTVTLSSIEHLAGLNISSGAEAILTRSTSRTLLVTSSPAIAGTLDLTDNDLDIPGGDLATIASLISSRIISGAATNDTTHLTTLGIIQNNQTGPALFTTANPLDGTTPGISDIIVRYTYVGDANLDGKVDGSDYSRIDNGYLTQATGWFNGDFNYDGVVNGSDYTLIDNAFNTQGAQLTNQIAMPTNQSNSTVAVPEPAAAALLGLAGLLSLSRRRCNF